MDHCCGLRATCGDGGNPLRPSCAGSPASPTCVGARVRMAWPSAPHPGCRRSVGAGQSAALLCAGTWHVRHASDQVSLSAGGPAGQPPSHWAFADPGRLAPQNTASMQSAHCRGARADGGPEPAQSGVYGARTRCRLCWGYDVSTHRVPWHVWLCRRESTCEALMCSPTEGALEPSAGAAHHPLAGGLCLLDQPRETLLGLCRRCGGLQGRCGASGAEFWAIRPRPG